MKYAILTPTFKEHFCFIDKYLKSFDKYVIDKDKFNIYFVIMSNEKDEFKKIISKYKHCSIKVLCFDEILKSYGIKQNADKIYKKYGKYTYQTLKKYYGLMCVLERYTLVVDSESMWIRTIKMSNVFDNYFKQPYFLVSDLEKRKSAIKEFVKTNPELWLYKEMELCSMLLDETFINEYFFEDYDWFYDKKIFNDFISFIGEPIKLLDKIDLLNLKFKHIFEIVLYRLFIFLNNAKYNYKIIKIDNLFKQYLSVNNFYEYKKLLMEKWFGNTGLAEQILILLDEKNIEEFIYIFKKLNLNCYRCQYTDMQNYKLQKHFINVIKPILLVTTQNHIFGGNNEIEILLKNSEVYKKYKKHIARVKNNSPTEIVSVIFYLIRMFLTMVCIMKEVKYEYKHTSKIFTVFI